MFADDAGNGSEPTLDDARACAQHKGHNRALSLSAAAATTIDQANRRPRHINIALQFGTIPSRSGYISRLTVMNFFKLAFWAVFAAVGVGAETNGWQPPGHVQVPIWHKAAPDPQPVRGPEVVEPSGNTFLVAGKQVIGVSNVTRPTMTVYSPERKNTGVAVIVFPGGGYQTLAIDLEGTEACDWLTSKESRVSC